MKFMVSSLLVILLLTPAFAAPVSSGVRGLVVYPALESSSVAIRQDDRRVIEEEIESTKETEVVQAKEEVIDPGAADLEAMPTKWEQRFSPVEAEEEVSYESVELEEEMRTPRPTTTATPRRLKKPPQKKPSELPAPQHPAEPVVEPSPSLDPNEPLFGEEEPLFKEGGTPTRTTSGQIRERRNFGIALHSSLLDAIVPLKYGASVSYIANASTTIELLYLRAKFSGGLFGIDLFDLRDERFSLLGRTFAGNSFNFHYGVTYFRFGSRVSAGDFVPGSTLPGFDLVQSEGYGFTAGIGNRWMAAEHVSIGVDWISWSQPLWMKQKSNFPDEAVKDAVQDDLKLLSYFPRLAFLHLQLGFYF